MEFIAIKFYTMTYCVKNSFFSTSKIIENYNGKISMCLFFESTIIEIYCGCSHINYQWTGMVSD